MEHLDSTDSNDPAEHKDSVARPKEGDLRIWWIPQVPMEPFLVSVESLSEARKLLDTLAHYDDFQYRNHIKPDYSNTGGLSVYEGGEWTDWYDEDGNDIDSEEVCLLLMRATGVSGGQDAPDKEEAK